MLKCMSLLWRLQSQLFYLYCNFKTIGQGIRNKYKQSNNDCFHNNTKYSCYSCDTDFTGRYCEESLDDCTEEACGDTGVCVDGIETYYCDCPHGMTGPMCDKGNEELPEDSDNVTMLNLSTLMNGTMTTFYTLIWSPDMYPASSFGEIFISNQKIMIYVYLHR